MKFWTEGRRKLVLGEQVFVVLVVFAFVRGASFSELAGFMMGWLPIMLAAHVAAEKLGKAAP